MPENSNKPLLDRILPWTTGITIPLLIIMMSALWGMSSQMSARASENEVLKARTDTLERAVLDIKTSVSQIDTIVRSLQITQTQHNTLIETRVDYIKKEVDGLKLAVTAASRPSK